MGEAIYRRGSAEGRIEGQITSLLTVLFSKGQVSEELEKKIQIQSRNELLDQWLKIAAVAPDVGAFGARIMR